MSPQIELLGNIKKFQSLFGKKEPLERKTLIRATCQLSEISETITSHNFRISMISRLLRVTPVQNVADIMGHIDIRTTMLYNRYRLTKAKILKIYAEAEEAKHELED